MFRGRQIAIAIMAAGAAIGADLASVKDEQKLDLRVDKALDHAIKMVDTARQSYNDGASAGMSPALKELWEAVDLARTTLKQMGKHPSKNTRNYKRAELKTRDLLRKLDSLRHDVSVDDRQEMNKLLKRLQDVHEELLLGVMSKRP